ncbi:hypothetical protein [Streptomyces sp. NPDC058374]|uniref:hypothetical protein n=1 Tax=unclassified Streptomyces TaxID=2593676 RepID=UPI00364857A1
MLCARCSLPFTADEDTVLYVIDSASAAGRTVEFHRECPDERAARLRQGQGETADQPVWGG